MAPTRPNSEPDRGFDAYASSYEAEVWRSIGFARQEHQFYVEAKARRLLEVGERHLGELGAVQALDVGCGIGLTDRHIVDRVGRLHGTDLSDGMLERAREANPGASYQPCEPNRLPYPDGRFDLVFAICVLHHVAPEDRPGFVGELHRVTRPAGLVVVIEHNPLNPLTRLAVHRCSFDEDVELLGRRQLRRRLADAGLEVIEAGFFLFTPWRGHFFTRLDRTLAAVPLGAQYFVAARR